MPRVIPETARVVKQSEKQLRTSMERISEVNYGTSESEMAN